MVAGRRPVAELLAAGRRPVRRLFVASGTKLPPDLAAAVRAAGVRVEPVSAEELRELSGVEVHQGVVAFTDELAGVDLAELTAQARLVIALDEVTDPRNVGAIARVGEGCGADGLIVTERRRAPLSAAAQKTAAGAAEWLPIAPVTNLAQALSEAKDAGMWVVGLEAEGEPLAGHRLLDERVVLVAGSEGRGMRPRIRSVCDTTVGIPMRGHVTSLNVSTAVAMVCWEICRRWDDGPGAS